MIYQKEIETDKDNKVKRCPRCDNEALLDSNYCQICGLELHNHCINCEDNG